MAVRTRAVLLAAIATVNSFSANRAIASTHDTMASVFQSAMSSVCIDEANKPSSKGALRKINGQVQRCDGSNRWVHQPTKSEQSANTSAAKGSKKDCKGEHGQMYESGLFRPSSSAYERCEDGRWLREKVKPS
jgi:hypothetical protein